MFNNSKKWMETVQFLMMAYGLTIRECEWQPNNINGARHTMSNNSFLSACICAAYTSQFKTWSTSTILIGTGYMGKFKERITISHSLADEFILLFFFHPSFSLSFTHFCMYFAPLAPIQSQILVQIRIVAHTHTSFTEQKKIKKLTKGNKIFSMLSFELLQHLR